MPIIKVENLSKSYEYYKKQPGLKASLKALFQRKKMHVKAIEKISFNIDEGELVGFLGPNGAGKTTTLKILSGILHPTDGKARVLGYEPWKRQKEYQKQFALVMGQKNQLWPDIPAMDSFVLNKEIYGLSNKEFKKNLSELVDVLDIKNSLAIQVRKLSLGQKMKCELAAALLHNPKVLFLDEPTIGLDVVAQKNIRDFIKKYNRERKTTVMLTSHYMEDISQLCKRIIIINLGKILYDGQLDDLIKKYAPYKLLNITFNNNGVKRHEIEKYGLVDKFNQFNVTFKIDRAKIKEVAIAILSSNLPVDDILIDEADIDDVIRKIFSSNKIG
ncbi:ATP-binding cassette domain-containing protein [Patescibacteria group bacterium]|nr:ATP-binding cassette domain-containing protein [Patescibacteria group bacterium]